MRPHRRPPARRTRPLTKLKWEVDRSRREMTSHAITLLTVAIEDVRYAGRHSDSASVCARKSGPCFRPLSDAPACRCRSWVSIARYCSRAAALACRIGRSAYPLLVQSASSGLAACMRRGDARGMDGTEGLQRICRFADSRPRSTYLGVHACHGRVYWRQGHRGACVLHPPSARLISAPG